MAKPTLNNVTGPEYAVFTQALLAAMPRLRRFCYTLTGSYVDADDLLQMTLERALEKWQSFEAGTEIQRWLYRVCRNIWIDEVRSSKRRGTSESLDDVDELEYAAAGESQLINSLTMDEVAAAMESLSESQRSILYLVGVDGCSYKDAAELLDLPIGTVMSRLARARKNLADVLEL